MRLSLLSLAVLCSALPAHASTISVFATPTTSPANGMMSTYSGVTTVTFNGSLALPAGFSGGSVVNGNLSNAYASPMGDTSNYYVVGTSPNYTGNASFTPGAAYNYFGLYWGSIDAYNTISFLLNGATVATYTGSKFPPANGNQTASGSNEYVDFLFNGSSYNQVNFSTTQANMELDNIAYGNVSPAVAATPEPSSLALMGTGLLGLVGMVRRRIA